MRNEVKLIFFHSFEAFESGKIKVSDYLRQMANQSTKVSTAADINSKKEKGLKRTMIFDFILLKNR